MVLGEKHGTNYLPYTKMVGTPVDLPQEFFRINRDIWQALTIKVGASFLTFSKSS